MTLTAAVGDRLVVRSQHLDGPVRDGETLDVRHADGSPPYVVRWSDSGRETLSSRDPTRTSNTSTPGLVRTMPGREDASVHGGGLAAAPSAGSDVGSLSCPAPSSCPVVDPGHRPCLSGPFRGMEHSDPDRPGGPRRVHEPRPRPPPTQITAVRRTGCARRTPISRRPGAHRPGPRPVRRPDSVSPTAALRPSRACTGATTNAARPRNPRPAGAREPPLQLLQPPLGDFQPRVRLAAIAEVLHPHDRKRRAQHMVAPAAIGSRRSGDKPELCTAGAAADHTQDALEP
jgi:hypothetical protein